MIGKKIRLERILDRNSRRTVIVPMDHGITMGPIPGLQDMKTTIDGDPTNTPKNESVEFSVRIPERRGCMEWNVRVGDRVIGEAWRRVFLGGSRLHASIAADDLFEKLVEGTKYKGTTIELDAPDIFGLQLKVVEELNRVAGETNIRRRFTIAG